ncbi:MAG: carboxymuconolactone decarboxylase family protein [Planctomycetaceae bacterium]
MTLRFAPLVFGLMLMTGFASAKTPNESPRPVPLTRPEMKQLIEDVKVRTPRIPMPELSAEDRELLGDRADEYESVIRHAYLPWVAEQRRARDRNQGPRPRGPRPNDDPNMSLDYGFKTQLFWIVSRVNNCQYCIGHQESKLLSAGLSEDQIALLDGDWAGHTPAERAAFAFARELAFEPHQITDADVEGLRKHYTDLQILEMLVSVCRNNVSNRWKEAVGVPQRKDEGGYARSDDPSLPRGSYLTPTSAKFQTAISEVAPIVFDKASGKPSRMTACRRPPLESRVDVEKSLESCRSRTARLPLVDEEKAREVLGELAPEGPLPSWMRLLANFPHDGVEYVDSIRSAEEQGDLSPLLKAQLAWIIARQDRAWYAAGESLGRLRGLGQTQDQIDALDGNWESFSPREQALFTVAKKLAASPVILTESDVAKAVELAGPRDVVQAINYTDNRAFFNRLTEAAGLPLED